MFIFHKSRVGSRGSLYGGVRFSDLICFVHDDPGQEQQVEGDDCETVSHSSVTGAPPKLLQHHLLCLRITPEIYSLTEDYISVQIFVYSVFTFVYLLIVAVCEVGSHLEAERELNNYTNIRSLALLRRFSHLSTDSLFLITDKFHYPELQIYKSS